MKKFISGMIVGALLFGAIPVFAASGLIGQKVQGLFSIEKNGTKISDAVIINGSAYAPVRDVAKATGATLTIEGKKIIMSGESTSSTSEEKSVKISTLNATIATYQSNIDIATNGELAEAEKNLKAAKAADSGSPESAFTISSIQKRVDASKAYILEQQALIDKAKAEIEKLQAKTTE